MQRLGGWVRLYSGLDAMVPFFVLVMVTWCCIKWDRFSSGVFFYNVLSFIVKMEFTLYIIKLPVGRAVGGHYA